MARARTRKSGDQPAEGSVVIDLNKPPPPSDPNQGKPVDYGKPAEPKADAAPRVETRPPPTDDDGNDLQAQVDALKKREAAARSRADQERQARVAAEQERLRAASQMQQERSQTEQAQYDSISNALMARENEIKTLNGSYQDALARGDHMTAAEINNRMLDAKMDMRDLANGKGEFDREFERRKREPQRQQFQQPQQQQVPQIEQILSQMPGLIPAEREWLREHPDAITNPRLQKQLEAAYLKAEDDGMERGSDEYFEFMEERLGYTGAEPRQRSQQPQYDEDDMDEPAPAPPRRRQSYAAPPSRSSPVTGDREHSGGGRVELNAEQRQAAKISNVDEYTYAKGVQRLRELKKKGYYQEVG